MGMVVVVVVTVFASFIFRISTRFMHLHTVWSLILLIIKELINFDVKRAKDLDLLYIKTSTFPLFCSLFLRPARPSRSFLLTLR